MLLPTQVPDGGGSVCGADEEEQEEDRGPVPFGDEDWSPAPG